MRSSLLDWVNNVTFDWDIGFIMGDSATPAAWKANVEGNYFVCPPGNIRSVALEKANLDRNGVPNFSLWQANNLMDRDGDGALNGTDRGWAIASGSYTKLTNAIARTDGLVVTQDPPLTAYKKILSQAGPVNLDASPSVALRDELDTILINNVRTQRRHHVSSVAGTGASNGGWGALHSAPPPVDTDRDGMPDFWEQAVGLNTGSDDHNTQVTAGAYLPNTPAGYTALEEYLHWLALPHALGLRNQSIDMDLRKFTVGFTNRSPGFTVSAITNGSVTLSNGYWAHFTPTTNVFGRARFNFTVTDADGSTWTQTFAALISPQAPPKSVVWRGDGMTNRWDILTNANWFDGQALVTFGSGDTVLFDDSGSNAPAIQLTGTLLPASVTVNAVRNYTFAGSGNRTATK